jgi:hypothetical protein
LGRRGLELGPRTSTFTADEEFGNFLSNSGTPSVATIYSMYLRLNLSTRPDLKLQAAIRLPSIILDPVTGNFKATYFCRILDKVT